MKWFKHLVQSTSDPDLMEAELKYKASATYVFWRTLEILAREDALDEPLVMNFKVFRRWFPAISCNKLIEILSFFDQKARITSSRLGENVTIYCNKLSTISSSYTEKVRRVSEQCTDSVRNLSAQKKIKEEDIDNNTAPISKIFIPPTIEEVIKYLNENNIKDVDPDKWWNFYNAKNWMIGKNKIKNWKSAVATWHKKSDNIINGKYTTGWKPQ